MVIGCHGEYLLINQQDAFCIPSFISGYIVSPTHPPTFSWLIAMISDITTVIFRKSNFHHRKISMKRTS